MEYFFGIVIFGAIFLIAWIIGNIRESNIEWIII
jgi:hypothetical protein